MSLFPMNREIRRAARCRCMGCEDCNWRESFYWMRRMHQRCTSSPHRPLATLVQKEKEIAMLTLSCDDKQREKNKLKARMLFRCALRDKPVPMTRERAQALVDAATCDAQLTTEQKIKALYPCHELIVEMNDGSMFVVQTEAYDGCDIKALKERSLREYLERELGWDDEDVKVIMKQKTHNVTIPGAKNIYVLDM